MTPRVQYAFIVVCVALVCVGICAYGAHAQKREIQATRFFSQALRDAHITAVVWWRGTEYTVTDGVVYAHKTIVDENSSFPLLKLAYAQALARRSPMFGIAGTEPDALKASVQSLSESVTDVANAATSSADALLIRSSLYPTSFLSSLAYLEEARLRFAASGTQTNALVYQTMLRRTAKIGRTDAGRFQAAMWHLFKDEQFIMYGVGGPISSQDLIRTSWNITLAMDAASDRIRKREQCLKGDVSKCDTRDLFLALPTTSASNVQESQKLPAQVLENRRIMASASEKPSETERPIVALQTSRCLKSLEAPYYVTPRNRIGTGDSFFFLNELFFARTANSANMLHRYLGQTLGISYMPLNQLTFYMCPDTQDDSGRARAILAATAYARSHPSSLRDRDALLTTSNIITEGAATRYMHALVDDMMAKDAVTTIEDMREVEELTLMFQYKNAGLNILVDEMAHINGTHARYAQSGIPFEENARVMFMTHSGFLSLFLAHNTLESYTYDAFRSGDKSDTAALYRAINPYSSLTRCVSEENIVQDIRSFLLFEGIGPEIADTASKWSNNVPERTAYESAKRIFGTFGSIPIGEQILPSINEFIGSFFNLWNDGVGQNIRILAIPGNLP